MPKLSRDDSELYFAVFLTISPLIIPMKWWLQAILLVVAVWLFFKVSFYSHWTFNWPRILKLILFLIVSLLMVRLSWNPIVEQFRIDNKTIHYVQLPIEDEVGYRIKGVKMHDGKFTWRPTEDRPFLAITLIVKMKCGENIKTANIQTWDEIVDGLYNVGIKEHIDSKIECFAWIELEELVGLKKLPVRITD